MVLLWAAAAEARSQIDIVWPLKEVFQIAVRFIRVDRGCKITDRDADAAYITFECEGDGGPKAPAKKGALELIPVAVQGRSGARVQLTLADEPRYVEMHLLELLERKIRDERGPALPPLRAPPPPSPDAGN
jgi:hypothetical protein